MTTNTNTAKDNVMNAHTAHKVSRAGSTPVYEYRGTMIKNISRPGFRAWAIFSGSTHTRYSNNLTGAKSFVDALIEHGVITEGN